MDNKRLCDLLVFHIKCETVVIYSKDDQVVELGKRFHNF